MTFLRKPYLNLLAFLLLMVACAPESIISVKDSHIDYKSLNGYDIYGYYSLPKTVLRFKIPVAEQKLQSGLVNFSTEHKCYREILKTNFGWEVQKAPTTKFIIDKKLVVNPMTVPDPNKRYAISYKNSKAISQTLNVSLSKDGLIQSGEFAQESKVFDVAKKSVELFGTLAGSLAGLGGTNTKRLLDADACTAAGLPDGRIKSLIVDASKLMETRYSLFQRVATGVNSTEIMKYHIAEIDKQIKAIKTALLGTITKTIHYVTIDLDLKKGDRDLSAEASFTKTLLSLNSAKGIVKTDEEGWKDWSSGIATDDATGAKNLVLMARRIDKPGKVREPKIDKGSITATTAQNRDDNDKYDTEAFLYYNIPAKYEIRLTFGDKPIQSYSSKKAKEGADRYSVYIPQLGTEGFLPKNFKEANVVYYQDIGALKSAKFVKAADLDADKVESFYNALDSVRNTLKAIKAAGEETEEEAPAEEVTEEVQEQVIRLIIDKSDT